MAYVVARPGGRFEIREAVSTPRGPRARSLANFAVLTAEVLSRAAGRAVRPFDLVSVTASARRAGAPVAADGVGAYRGFVESSRRMGARLEDVPPARRAAPGAVLMELLEFTDLVSRSQPPRLPETLEFPPLARLVAERRGGRSRRG